MKIRLMVVSALLVVAPVAAFAGATTGGATVSQQLVQEHADTVQLSKQTAKVSAQLRQLSLQAKALAAAEANTLSEMHTKR